MSNSATELVKLSGPQIAQQLTQLENTWSLDSEKNEISKTFEFKGYYKTIAFVNCVAWIAQTEKHHPDLEVGYGKCTVRYTTHDVDGLSMNDFNCARLIDAL